jgi:hypothetical protein
MSTDNNKPQHKIKSKKIHFSDKHGEDKDVRKSKNQFKQRKLELYEEELTDEMLKDWDQYM